MILQEQPTNPWKDFDFKLLEAYEILQSEICPKCQNPIWLCRNEDPDVIFEVRSAVCFAEKALERERERREGKNDKEKAKQRINDRGRYWFTVPKMNPASTKTDLPTRREFYSGETK